MYSKNLDLKIREEEYQRAIDEYRRTKSKESWELLWRYVMDCCHNICAKKLIGVRIDPDTFEDRVMDSAAYTMRRIREGLNPRKLSSYCYLVCVGRLYGQKALFEDRCIVYASDINEVKNDG